MSGPQPDQDEAISQFSDLTGVAPSEARQYLEANEWDLGAAAAEYYTSLEEATNEAQPPTGSLPNIVGAFPEAEASPIAPPPAYSGGRTLGGASVPQPIPTSSSMADQSSSSSRAAPKKKFATLGDLSGGSGAGQGGHGHDHDSDDSDEDSKQNLFAGGGKSGLAVKNPNQNTESLKKKILERARKYV
ncbi:MAG: hypothetical protein Q9194_006379 [Teloschistes cf. exilis]